MKKITLLAIIICSLISSTVKSQYAGEKNSYNNDYNRARREVQKEYEAQADRNRQPNSPSGNYNTSLSPEELQALDDKLKRAAGKMTAAEIKAARAKADSASRKKFEAFEEKQAAERAVWEKELQIDRDNAAPITRDLIMGGFELFEAERMAKNYVWYKKYNSYDTSGFLDHLFEANKNLLFLKQNITTANYEPLLYATIKLVQAKAQITSNNFLDILALRFPEKEKEIDLFRLDLFVSYFKEYRYAFGGSWLYYEGVNKRMIDSYLSFEDRNPGTWSQFKNRLSPSEREFYNPYSMLDFYYEEQIKCTTCHSKKERKKLQKIREYFLSRKYSAS